MSVPDLGLIRQVLSFSSRDSLMLWNSASRPCRSTERMVGPDSGVGNWCRTVFVTVCL
jgi:hypothetical protein